MIELIAVVIYYTNVMVILSLTTLGLAQFPSFTVSDTVNLLCSVRFLLVVHYTNPFSGH